MKYLLFTAALFVSFYTQCNESVSVNSARPTLTLAVSAFEPWTIVNGDKVEGIDILLINELAKRINIDINYIHCPWQRCLAMAEDGEIDIVTNLFKNDDRERYLTFISPPYLTGTYRTFYQLKSNQQIINSYEDLRNLKIGVRTGIMHFERFDKDTLLRKVPLNSDTQLLQILYNNRVDVIVGQEKVIDYLLATNEQYANKITKAEYRIYNADEGYIGLSKKSKHHALLPILKNEMKQIIKEDLLSSFMRKYEP